MEAFFRTHAYLVEHTNATLRRTLMDEIDWDDRMIGIKGTRGVGKTTFLLQYAKEKFARGDRQCLTSLITVERCCSSTKFSSSQIGVRNCVSATIDILN